MLLSIDTSSSVGLADQVANSMRHAIAVGEVEPGERIPSARELASALGINVHTVLAGLATLRDEGLLEMRSGRGIRVSADAARLSDHASALLQEIVSEARRLGLSQSTVQMLLAEEFAR